MNIKKIIYFIIAILLSFQCTVMPGFAADSDEMEVVYSVSQIGNNEYGYLDYFFVDENGNSVEF